MGENIFNSYVVIELAIKTSRIECSVVRPDIPAQQ